MYLMHVSIIIVQDLLAMERLNNAPRLRRTRSWCARGTQIQATDSSKDIYQDVNENYVLGNYENAHVDGWMEWIHRI